MNQIELKQFTSPDQLSGAGRKDLARLYGAVFAPPPWNEAVRCRQCLTFQGQSVQVGTPCPCGGDYEVAYPIDETMRYIDKEGSREGFRLAAVGKSEFARGFAWSYITTPTQLVADKWKSPECQQQILAVLQRYDIDRDQKIRYMSECGLDPDVRGSGLAYRLTRVVAGPEISICRTNCKSPVVAINEKLGFIQVMGPEMLIDRISRTITPTGKVINSLDSENPDRVLFVKYFNE